MMNVMVEVGLVGHVVHYAVLAGGLAGLAALLGPQLLGTSSRSRTEPRDAHERQVMALRAAMAGGPDGTTLTKPRNLTEVTIRPTRAARVVLPVVVVGSGAAALAHGAVGPEHFEEGTLLGLFFVTSAVLQLAWAVAVARHCTPSLLFAGLLGNAAVIALWATTRTVGLPLGLLPEGPEAVGPWDSACLVWELAVVVGCATLLRRPRLAGRVAVWGQWPPAVRLWTLASVLAIGALTLIGHGA